MIVLKNTAAALSLDEKTGAVLQLEDCLRGRTYIDAGASLPPPFRVEKNGQMLDGSGAFTYSQTDNGLSMCWEMDTATVQADIRLLEDGFSFAASLENRPGECCRALEYPVLEDVRDYGMEGYLAHAYATGILLQDPAAYVPSEGALRFTPYPEGFSGATMQFFTYYQERKGGLYFAALDGHAHQKWLNCYTARGKMAFSHMAGFEDIGPGKSIAMTYPVVVRFTAGHGWEEAAQMYKVWALKQSWCMHGPAHARKNKADWLLEKSGACTFGINAKHNRTKWLRRYRRDIGTPIFHVLGPDWTNREQNFYNSVPGAMQDWLPTRFSKENLQAIQENGDFLAPFEFDFLVGLDKSDPETLKANLQKYPKPTYSHDGYTFNMLCPCTEFTKNFHRERDVQVLREAHVDAMYYDISANNLIKVCLADDHGHAVGGGREITEGYREIYENTREALCQEAGHYVPLGTEMINEVFLPQLDFYQARAWGQPCSTLETYPFRAQMRNGLARMIPLFDFVYHPYGVVRMDGWGKLVKEIGELFYYNAARVYLWGGLYEINHEYSPMEELDGEENSGEEHYFHFDPQHCAYDEGRAAYLKAFAALRTGLANPYWAYGDMRAVPEMALPQVEMDWYHYNHGQKDTSYKARGVIKVPAVVASAYEAPDGGYALFLANADKSSHQISFALGFKSLGFSGGPRKVTLFTGFDREQLRQTDFGMLRDGETMHVDITLSPCTLYMLEVK